jgi:serine/threonine protein phosphatase PrpC
MAEVEITLGSLSSVGRVREGNEDSFGCFQPSDARELRIKGRLFVLADGMGGEAAGEVASRMAVEVARSAYFADPFRDPVRALEESVRLANGAIHRQASENLELKRMGTTCTALVLRDQRAYVAHVGDSRAYLIRDGGIVRLTRDHSMAEKGRAFAHILTRALGVEPSVEVDLLAAPLALQARDILLLCSDGLWGQVDDHELLAIAGAEPDPQEACRRLVNLANQRGGPDNITVVIARVDGAGQRTRLRRSLRWLMGRESDPRRGIAWVTRSLGDRG